MKKASLLTAVALAVASLTAAPLTPPVAAQDTFGIDSTSGYNSLLARSQIKHKSPGALDPLSVRNRYLKRNAARKARYHRRSRSSSTGRRTRTNYRLRR